MDYFDLIKEKHISQEKFAEECGYDLAKMMQEAKKTTIELAKKYNIDIKFKPFEKNLENKQKIIQS